MSRTEWRYRAPDRGPMDDAVIPAPAHDITLDDHLSHLPKLARTAVAIAVICLILDVMILVAVVGLHFVDPATIPGWLSKQWAGAVFRTEMGFTGPGPGEKIGGASYYGEAHHGRPTASGEPFDMHAMTAAHRTLPFGTRVRVTDVATEKSVVVRINDRGPFVPGRIIDLSKAAAEALGMIDRGVSVVRLEVLGG